MLKDAMRAVLIPDLKQPSAEEIASVFRLFSTAEEASIFLAALIADRASDGAEAARGGRF